MLRKLIIRNYAIIDRLTFEPDDRLNTVTGETGAGKSIILGALSLILGERADTSVLINKQEKSVVEGHFDVQHNAGFQQALRDAELDAEDTCIIRREIAANGKARAFINDTPVTLAQLNKLTSLLVDLHQQFGHLALEEDAFQLEALDAIGKTSELAAGYRQLYYRHKSIKQKLADLRERQSQWHKEADYKQYLLDELVQAAFKSNEIEDTELQLRQLEHAGRILSILDLGREMLEEGEQPILPELKKMNTQLGSLLELVPSLKPVHERANSVLEELKDIAAELSREAEKVTHDPELMDVLQERLDVAYRLLKKHGARTTNDLLELKKHLESELKATMDMQESIEKLAEEEGQLFAELVMEAGILSAGRKKAATGFVPKINNLLALVGMPNARFDIRIEPIAPGTHGADNVQFLLDANKSGQFQLLQKAASGGEMSRIMLCIKSLTAEALNMPTLIFDEVDTGISGEAARQVGQLLRELSAYHQVICITHQPQVAARGTRHFYVYKQADATGRLTTSIRPLAQDERILTIARMIGGENPSEAAISNARELCVVQQ